MSWNWYLPPPSSNPGYDLAEPVLAEPSILRIDLAESRTDVGTVETSVRLNHARLPVGWIDAMTDFWAWQMERLDTLLD
jgi:hypothetical protein